ncbi:DUF305 domain-containing protein [Catenuloplanes atrovinosus]|uniref:Uncharacterized protein (DUF305 family) n=1 Tax=Catenuloplanes atrovinosus TaxID=137266 RepID=A0AAE3YK08_9ACTN|nr:DUF305 domain-containing protein [Catenuloplanes atrovinosus]MDR7273804.1 uncharacterized protein (DUF305 family) [Catenuloplanes atrovinosus]
MRALSERRGFVRYKAWWAALVVPVLALSSGCADPAPEAAAPPSAPSVATSSTFNGTDVAWIQLMIPMTEQLVPLLEIAAERASSAPLRDLSARLRDTHRAEAVELRALLARTGLPDTNPHEGHNMPGMVTPDEVTTLAQAQGAAFDEGVTTSLRDYLAQVAMISGSESEVGTDPQTTALAARIAASREQDLAALEKAAT